MQNVTLFHQYLQVEGIFQWHVLKTLPLVTQKPRFRQQRRFLCLQEAVNHKQRVENKNYNHEEK